MKKIISILFILMVFVTGCGKYGEKEILRDISKNINGLKSYYLEGKMEIINNEDIYKYDVKVSFKENDFYKVSLKNESNNHEQVILKNEEGVYVLTPSLNKSFKFESEWPYNNSQVYLLKSLVDDLNNDKSYTFETKDEMYVFTFLVNYPNNKTLVKQEMYLDKDLNIKEVHVLNESGNTEIKMIFNSIDKSPTFNDDYFTLKSNIEVSNVIDDIKPVTDIDEAIFPMFLPENTTLKSQDVITKDNGERVILTFAGDKPFILIEETASKEEEYEIIPTLGEPVLLIDTIGSVSDDSISWISKGMQYYITSNTLSKDELLKVAKSISTIPVMK